MSASPEANELAAEWQGFRLLFAFGFSRGVTEVFHQRVGIDAAQRVHLSLKLPFALKLRSGQEAAEIITERAADPRPKLGTGRAWRAPNCAADASQTAQSGPRQIQSGSP